MNTKYSIEYFQQFAAEKAGKCLSNSYANVKTKLWWRCKDGHTWEAQPRKILEGSWCPQCARERIRKYSVDDAFFSRDTEAAFYIAGFWAADGWKTRASQSYYFGLNLSVKDIEHMARIRSVLNAKCPITTFWTNQNKLVQTSSEQCEFHFCSEQAWSDIERFGVVERKTYKLYFPEWLKTHPLVHHFMRGYIDGDGCFTTKEQDDSSKPSVFFCMRGTVEFLQGFQDVLDANGISKNNDGRKKLSAKDGTKRLAFDVLRYGGNAVISKMYDFLYHDATIFLERKRAVAAKAKEWGVYKGGTNKKKRKSTSLPMTKDLLLHLAKTHGSGEKIAEILGCTSANVSWWVKNLGVHDEYHALIAKRPVVTKEILLEVASRCKTGRQVANELERTPAAISALTKKFGIREEFQKSLSS